MKQSKHFSRRLNGVSFISKRGENQSLYQSLYTTDSSKTLAQWLREARNNWVQVYFVACCVQYSNRTQENLAVMIKESYESVKHLLFPSLCHSSRYTNPSMNLTANAQLSTHFAAEHRLNKSSIQRQRPVIKAVDVKRQTCLSPGKIGAFSLHITTAGSVLPVYLLRSSVISQEIWQSQVIQRYCNHFKSFSPPLVPFWVNS